ncbi:hypothetical protein [Aureibacter tunicatorum]|uniref:Outer membrane protein beta-barrel domain-containing protein n=1 Tax=Aureibacter tunicatorum TaxID=866807 RepID=A0AAE3XRM3_9BACT|nr:hypothetical protein [Aureibacter tunicatorum]MDR6240788.1 hypothetical protein [Aureibacter tunicatorum]BDD06879.1 hypothetical protein AUTU_43620 [Aureibacter tunicatorum]
MKKLLALCLAIALSLSAKSQTFTVQGTWGLINGSSSLYDDYRDLSVLSSNDVTISYADINTWGAEASVYIIKGWGVNIGYAYGEKKSNTFVTSTGLSSIPDARVFMNQINIGLAKKFKLPLVHIIPIAGINIYNYTIKNFPENNGLLPPNYNLKNKDVTNYGLDLGVNAKILLLSAGVKYDIIRNYFKLSLGIGI